MKYKIVADSSSNIMDMEGINYASVPLKIITSEKEYEDNRDLDISQMVDDLSSYKGISITSSLSGSYELLYWQVKNIEIFISLQKYLSWTAYPPVRRCS